MSDQLDEHLCPSCGTALSRHDGLYRLCELAIGLRKELAEAKRGRGGRTVTIPAELSDAYVALQRITEQLESACGIDDRTSTTSCKRALMTALFAAADAVRRAGDHVPTVPEPLNKFPSPPVSALTWNRRSEAPPKLMGNYLCAIEPRDTEKEFLIAECAYFDDIWTMNYGGREWEPWQVIFWAALPVVMRQG